LRALRANRVFCADEKAIRTENTVIGKSKGGLVLKHNSKLAISNGLIRQGMFSGRIKAHLCRKHGYG